jgi:hypothetical protein
MDGTTPASEMKTEELLPAHVALDRQIAEIRALQAELHEELTTREEAARRAAVANRPANFPPAQNIGGVK